MSEIPRPEYPSDEKPFEDTVPEVLEETKSFYREPEVSEAGPGVNPESNPLLRERIELNAKYPQGEPQQTFARLANGLKTGGVLRETTYDVRSLAVSTGRTPEEVLRDIRRLADLLAAEDQEAGVTSHHDFSVSDQPLEGQGAITEAPSTEQLAPESQNDSDRFIGAIRGKLASYPEVLQVLEDAYSDVGRLVNENWPEDTIAASVESWRGKLRNAASVYGVPKDDPEYAFDRMFNTYMNHRGSTSY